MNSNRTRWGALTLATLAFGCGPSATEGPRLRLAAASDLQLAIPVLLPAFRQVREIEVDVTFGASGQLAEQIKQGAPFDVFLSADRKFVQNLADQRIIKPTSVRAYARGSLVLAVNRLSAVKVKTLDDLTKPEVHRIAIANPETAPYGMAARQALERAKLWDVLGPKIVPAESVRQALQFVQSGNAEVGLVGRSISDVREVLVVPLPPEAHEPIVQVLGIVDRTAQPDDASAFVDFLLGEVGQGMLRDLGFGKPPTADGVGVGAGVVGTTKGRE